MAVTGDWKPRAFALIKACSTMPEYRAYIIGGDGDIAGFEPIVSPDDAGAIRQARQLVNGYAVELWSGPRLVIRLEPWPETKAS